MVKTVVALVACLGTAFGSLLLAAPANAYPDTPPATNVSVPQVTSADPDDQAAAASTQLPASSGGPDVALLGGGGVLLLAGAAGAVVVVARRRQTA